MQTRQWVINRSETDSGLPFLFSFPTSGFGDSPYQLENAFTKLTKPWTRRSLQIVTQTGIIDTTSDGRSLTYETHQEWRRASDKYTEIRKLNLFRTFYIRRGLMRFRTRVRMGVFRERQANLWRTGVAVRPLFIDELLEVSDTLRNLVDVDIWNITFTRIFWGDLLHYVDTKLDEVYQVIRISSERLQASVRRLEACMVHPQSSSSEFTSHQMMMMSVSDRRKYERDIHLKSREHSLNVNLFPRYIRLIGLRLQHALTVAQRNLLRNIDQTITPSRTISLPLSLGDSSKIKFLEKNEIATTLLLRSTRISEMMRVTIDSSCGPISGFVQPERNLEVFEGIISRCEESLKHLPTDLLNPICVARAVLDDSILQQKTGMQIVRLMSEISEMIAKIALVPQSLESSLFTLETSSIVAETLHDLNSMMDKMRLQVVQVVRSELRETQSSLDLLSRYTNHTIRNIDEFIDAKSKVVKLELTEIPQLQDQVNKFHQVVETMASFNVRLANEDSFTLECITGRLYHLARADLMILHASIKTYETQAKDYFASTLNDYQRSWTNLDKQVKELQRMNPLDFPSFDHLQTDSTSIVDLFEHLMRIKDVMDNGHDIVIQDPFVFMSELKTMESEFTLLRQYVDAQAYLRSLPLAQRRVQEFEDLVTSMTEQMFSFRESHIRECMQEQIGTWTSGRLEVLKMLTQQELTSHDWGQLGIDATDVIADLTPESLEERGIFNDTKKTLQIILRRRKMQAIVKEYEVVPMPIVQGRVDKDNVALICSQMLADCADDCSPDEHPLKEPIHYLKGLGRLIQCFEDLSDEESLEQLSAAFAELCVPGVSVLSWYKSCPTASILAQPYLLA